MLEEDCLLLLDPSLLLRTTEEDEETALTEDEEEVAFADDEEETFEELLLVMPDGACPELDEWVPASPFLLLLEGRFALEAGMTEEEEDVFVTLDEDCFLTEEEDSSFWTLLEESFSSLLGDVPLSPPQAMRAMVSKRTIMDPIALCAPG